ncbi:MAG: 50S ribosomal protein L6 [Armatimonadota bacterium]|jgi:large subunit ribosomal protein L6
MSRIGMQPVELPDGVTVEVGDGNAVTVTGPRGTLSRSLHPEMILEREDGRVSVKRPSETKEHRSLHGLTRTLLANMVEGVSEGFEKRLELRGVGYRAELQDEQLVLQVGLSHPVHLTPPEGIELQVDTSTGRTTGNMPVTVIVVRGISKEQVGQTAAEIRRIRKAEPFKGKGIRYQGEYIRRKAGKAGKIGTGVLGR